MNRKEIRKLERIACEASNVFIVSKFLDEALCNDSGNLTERDICTLSYLLTRMSRTVVKMIDKFMYVNIKNGI